MSERRWEAELEELIGADPETLRVSRILEASKLRPAPLDPRFKQDLRRRLMEEAYDRLPARPSIFSRLFGAPGLALAATAVGAVLLVAALYVLHTSPGTSSQNVYIDNTKPVAVDQSITVKFTQPVPEAQHQALEQAIQIQPATRVTYTWSGNNLVVKPVDGNFAGDTQYHLIVPASATGTSKQADLTFRTQPAPSPPPVAPSPVAPSLAIISNQSIGPASAVVGWSSQHQLVYIAGNGDLDSAGADGSGSRTLASGVSFAALSPDGTQVLYATSDKVEQLPAAGGTATTLANSKAAAVYWLGSTPAYSSGSAIVSANSSQTVLFRLPAQAVPWPAPNGGDVLFQSGSAISEGASHPWTQAVDKLAWSADSSRVAYSNAGGVYVASPDGSGAKQVLTAGGEPRWADGQTLFVSSNEGSFLVGADGSNKQQLAASATGAGAVFDGSSTLAVVANGTAQVLKVGPATGLDLQAGNSVVKAFEDARVSGDSTGAGRQLDASAARNAPPLVSAAQPHLSRWFPISAQAVAGNPASLRYVVRLVYTKDASEVRRQDETLTLVASSGGLVIDGISDSAPMSWSGPQVIGVQVLAGSVIVGFDSDLDPSSLTGAFHVLTPDGKELPSQISYSARTVTIAVALAPARHYTLVIDPTLRDVAGGAPPQGYRQDLFGQ